MAEIYLAQIKQTQQLVVVKALKPSLYQCQKERALFINEARLLINLHHQNIVKAHELIHEKEQLFLVMEYIIGKPVEQFLSKELPSNLRARLALSVGIQIGEALSYAWSCLSHHQEPLRLIHKDISPQNLIVSVEGLVKLIDFGVATTVHTKTDDDKETLLGTIHYMSPEQIAGATLSQTSDIYSLARVMLEIIRGEKCRSLDKHEDYFMGVKNYPITKDLHKVLSIGLAEKPSERFQTCQELLLSLKKIEDRFHVDKESVFKESLRQISKVNQPKKAKWTPLLRYLAQLCSLSSALVVMMFVLFCIFVELFKAHLFVISPAVSMRFARGASLENSDAIGKLILKVHPSAEVFIGDQFYGATPIPELRLPAGEYLIQLQNQDHSTIALRKVRIYADKETILRHIF